MIDEGWMPVFADGVFHAGLSMPSENAMERTPATHAKILIRSVEPPF
jgi:hypothetical protein